jgi:signal peptidase I
MSKFRVGDRVMVEGKVVGISGHMCGIEVDDGSGDFEKIFVADKVMKLVQMGPPAPGDIVIHKDDESRTYQVLAIHQVFAWVGRVGEVASDLRFLTIAIDNLVVVERAPVG